MKTISIGGMGGFELGLKAALESGAGDGAPHAVAFCEVERRAKDVLRHHWPEAMTYSDIWDLINHAGSIQRRSIDIICGKFGAGDVTVSGARERVVRTAGRFEGYARLMRTLQPQYGLIEFESSILTRDRGRRFQAVLAHLTGWVPTIPADGWRSFGLATPAPGLGDDAYGVAWRVLDLRGFAAPGDIYRMERSRLYLALARGRAVLGEIFLDERDLAGLPIAIDEPENASVDEENHAVWNAVVFDGRSGAMNYSPIVRRTSLPTIHGQNVALAFETLDRIRWLTPEECEMAFTLPGGFTAIGRRITDKMNKDIEIKDAPRYRMIGRHTVPPAIIEWIASRMITTT